MSKQLIPLESLSNLGIGRDDAVIFGGTFDPLHAGHVTVVERLLPYFATIHIAPTDANPWKAESPTPFALRVEMIRLVLEAEGLDRAATKIELLEVPYVYAADLVDRIRPLIQGDLYWAVAEDSAQGVSQWKDWAKRGVPVIVCPITRQLHATQIRSGEIPLHPALQAFATNHKLYGA